MKKSNFSESQRKAIVEKRSQGQSVEEICRAHQISPATFYKWKRELKDMANEDKRRLRELEKENARLKKMYSELMIDHDILKEGLEIAKKISARDKGKKW